MILFGKKKGGGGGILADTVYLRMGFPHGSVGKETA